VRDSNVTPITKPASRTRARAKWTATSLAILPQGVHTDPSTTGLQRRVRGSTRTWLYRYRWGKQMVRITLGHFPAVALADARQEAHKLRRFQSQNIDPRSAQARRPRALTVVSSEPGHSHSIETLCKEFMDRYIRVERKHHEPVQAMLNRDVLAVWRGRDARTIRPREVIELLDRIVERGSAVMANHVASLLSQMFRFGIHRAIVETSPVQLLYKPGGKETPRSRVLSDTELKTFLSDPQACTRFEKLSHVILILLLTGQRRRELAVARWKNVDLEAKLWTIPAEDSKSGRGHAVPLSNWAVREFEALHRERHGSPFVMPGNDGQAHDPKLLTRAMARCQKRFQAHRIAHFTLHDLRRTCRTGLARLKIAPHVAERVLNHVQDGIAAVYDVHDYLDEKREALTRWQTYLETLRDQGGDK
jgi:integrase